MRIEVKSGGDEVIAVGKNQGACIPMGAEHHLENRGNEPLHIVGIQVGGYLGEDDIQCFFEDNQGR